MLATVEFPKGLRMERPQSAVWVQPPIFVGRSQGSRYLPFAQTIMEKATTQGPCPGGFYSGAAQRDCKNWLPVALRPAP